MGKAYTSNTASNRARRDRARVNAVGRALVRISKARERAMAVIFESYPPGCTVQYLHGDRLIPADVTGIRGLWGERLCVRGISGKVYEIHASRVRHVQGGGR